MSLETPELRELILKAIKEWKIPGLSIAIVRGDEIEAKAYGTATFPDQNCTTSTLFDCASTSKTTTAAAIALLVDDPAYSTVQWTTPVSHLLPDDFILPTPQLTKDITIEDILTHRTGLPRHDESYLSVRAAHPDNAQSITRNLRNLPFVKPLRTTFMYSNIMYTVASHLVEMVSGIAYTTFLREKLWEPLGMSNTFHDIPDIASHAALSRKATAYRWDKETSSYVDIPAYPQPEGQGAGCIFSSAADYAKWIRALIHQGPPLSGESHKQLITPRTIEPSDPAFDLPFTSTALYALGLSVQTYRGHTVIGHDGSVPGFKSCVLYLPGFEWGIVVLANLQSAEYARDIIVRAFVDEVLGVPKDERVDWEQFFLRAWERDEREGAEVKEEFVRPEVPEGLGLELQEMVGRYWNKGYKGLVLEMRDGDVLADLGDRCFPSVLRFEHLTANKFVVGSLSVWDEGKFQMKGEVRLDGGKVVAVGVGLEEDMGDELIWFERVE